MAFRIAVLLLLLGTTASAVVPPGGLHLDSRFETSEGGGFDSEGQITCIEEALEFSNSGSTTSRCPVVPLKAAPYEGVLIFDHWLESSPLGWDPYRVSEIQRGVLPTPSQILSGGIDTTWNLHRSSGGLFPDIVLPGRVDLSAWLVYWKDLDGDGVASTDSAGGVVGPKNEVGCSDGISMVYYLEPGSRPRLDSTSRPDSQTPDLTSTSGCPLAGATGTVLMVDGSLFEPLRSTGVSAPILVPDPEGRPYTTTENSRVDIDEYVALLPDPLRPIYESLAPAVRDFFSPSVGSAVGLLPPEGLSGTPLSGLAGNLYSPYPREWAGDDSTDSLYDYRVDYSPWIDLLPRYGYSASSPTFQPSLPPRPLPGSLEGIYAPPGFLVFEIRAGVWKDLNGDGFIGSVGTEDPYQGGSRPIPDEYDNPHGEFFPSGTPSSPGPFEVVLTPDPDWGAGVIPLATTGALPRIPIFVGPNTTVELHPEWTVVTGNTPVRLPLGRSYPDFTPGRFWSNALLLPAGTEGFSIHACSPSVRVSYSMGSVPIEADVWDCDTIHPIPSI